MVKRVSTAEEWIESIEGSDEGAILIFVEAAGTRPGDGKVDMALRLAGRLEGCELE